MGSLLKHASLYVKNLTVHENYTALVNDCNLLTEQDKVPTPLFVSPLVGVCVLVRGRSFAGSQVERGWLMGTVLCRWTAPLGGRHSSIEKWAPSITEK